MKIKKFAFGNSTEAFVESRLGDRVNIIYSNDNNKGKTLALQAIMYALGNEPIFPAGFNGGEHYFYIELSINDESFKILRKNNTFSVVTQDSQSIFDSLSEFKYFFDKKIHKLPEIMHRGSPKVVDPSLFLQIFFVGQDKRDTSTIFNSGYYNKSDFVEMLYSLRGLSNTNLSSDEINELKDRLKQLRIAEAKLAKEIDRFNINKAVLESVKTSASYKYFEEQEKALKTLNEKLVSLRKRKYAETTRLNNKINLEVELNSLNRAISFGQVSCDDCGGQNINYKSKDLSFDISNKEVRESIIKSLQESIKVKRESISKIYYEIELIQKKLNEDISKLSPELRDIILFSDELNKSGSLDKERIEKQREIELITSKLKDSGEKQQGLHKNQAKLIDGIIKVMNEIYKIVDENGVQKFTDLFTKKSVNYSGSEEQEFYFAKVYALQAVFKHHFPIVIDSFRDRELSSDKESRMVDIFESLENQVILTATLKKEEYNTDKYESYGVLNVIDYSSHSNSRILSESYLKEFLALCGQFGVTLQ